MVKEKDIGKSGKFLGTRIDDRLSKIISKYTKTYNISNSDLIRKALRYYTKYAQIAKLNTSYVEPIIMVTKQDLKFLINQLNDDQLKELSKQTYGSVLRGIKEYVKQIGFENFNPTDFDLNNLIQSLVRDVLNYDAQNIFDHVKYSYDQKKKILTIGGTHGIGENYSKALKYFFLYLMEPYSYELIEEILQENRIYLKFIQKIQDLPKS